MKQTFVMSVCGHIKKFQKILENIEGENSPLAKVKHSKSVSLHYCAIDQLMVMVVTLRRHDGDQDPFGQRNLPRSYSLPLWRSRDFDPNNVASKP
jgi:hypothetical protein